MKQSIFDFIKLVYGAGQKFLFQLFPKSIFYEKTVINTLLKISLYSESLYWKSWIKSKAFGDFYTFESELNKSKDFPEYLRKLLKDDQNRYDILDVGSGPVSVLGYNWLNKSISLIPVDPLAIAYNKALDKSGIIPPVRTIYAQAECLTKHFPENNFDLVHASNSIDHCFNPVLAIEQMLKVVKSGCYIYLKHFINEADNENYAGMHTWNFNKFKNDFIISNIRNHYNVSEIFKEWANINVTLAENNIIIVLLKKH